MFFVFFSLLGHVDAGKSTLMGHLLYQLGSVNKRSMHKYEQESKKVGKGSFAYAWVLDETEEERWGHLFFGRICIGYNWSLFTSTCIHVFVVYNHFI